MDRMAATVSTAADRQALQDASTRLRERLRSASKEAFSSAPFVALLDRVAATDTAAGRELEFQGSYTQPTTKEPAYGGHGSAMGPPPTEMPRAAATSPVQFEDVPCLTAKTYCGSRTKDHILESGGSGVAMFDYRTRSAARPSLAPASRCPRHSERADPAAQPASGPAGAPRHER